MTKSGSVLANYGGSTSGAGQNFQVGASDPSGLTTVQIIFNWQPTGVDGCSIYYDVVNDALSVADLTGSTATFGQTALLSPAGTLGDLVNSNCAIMGAGSRVTETLGPTRTDGTRPVLSVSIQLGITFRGASTGTPGFVGRQNIYMMKTSNDEPTGAFQQVGTWTAYPAPAPGSYSNVAAPSGTVNADGTVTLAFYDSNGFNYQPYAEIVFSATSSNPAADPNACRIRYDRGTGSSNHVLGLYSGDFTAASLWGAAPVGQAGAIVQRNQNCRLDIGRSYVLQESGTGASVNLALTFPTTGKNYFWAQSYDRQNAGGAVQTGSLYIPPNSFTLKTSASMSQPFAVQAGSSGSFTLNAPATGTFSGNVALSYAAPTGVSVTFQANPVASPGSTTFTVAASASAAVGNGTITITGMGGGITSVVSVPFMVTAAGGGTTTYSAPATFALSGSQTLNVSVTPPITGPIATFVVTATGFNGFSAGQLIGLSTDSNVKTASLSYSPLASVYAGQSVTVGLTPLGQGTPVAGGLQYCGVIDAFSVGYSNSSITLCANVVGATQSISFSVPQPSTGIIVAPGGSVTIQGAVSTFGSTGSVSLAQSVTCPAGISPCDASATFGTLINGAVSITLNAGSLPDGTTYFQNVSANGVAQRLPITVHRGQAPFYFTVPQSITVYPGTSVTSSVSVTGVGAFAQPITLSASSPGTGVTVSLDASTVTPPATIHLTTTAASSAPVESTSVTIVGNRLFTSATSTVPVAVSPLTQPVLSTPESQSAAQDTPAPIAFPPVSQSVMSCNDISGTWTDDENDVITLDQSGESVAGTISQPSPNCGGTTSWSVAGQSMGAGAFSLNESGPAYDACGAQEQIRSVNVSASVLSCSTLQITILSFAGPVPTFNSAAIPLATTATARWFRSSSPPGVTVTVDLLNDLVTTQLLGSTKSGAVALTIRDSSGNATALATHNSAVAGTSLSDGLMRTKLAPGQYGTVNATWDTTSVDIPVSFYVIGNTRFSQYNTPYESQCSANPTPAMIIFAIDPGADGYCHYMFAQMGARFISQVALNGTGVNLSGTVLKSYNSGAKNICPLSSGYTADNTFFALDTGGNPITKITGSGGSVMSDGTGVVNPLNSNNPQTGNVATDPLATAPNGGTFRYGDQLLLVGPGDAIDTRGLRSVQDLCPACHGGFGPPTYPGTVAHIDM